MAGITRLVVMSPIPITSQFNIGSALDKPMESEFQMSFASLYPFPFSSDGEPDAHEHDRKDSERDGDVLEVALEGKGERGYDDAEDRSQDRKSTRLNSSHGSNSYAVFC